MGTNRILRCLVFLLCNFGLFPFGRAIWLSLPPSGTKCVSEEVQTNVVVLGDYIVIPDDGASHVPKLSAKAHVFVTIDFTGTSVNGHFPRTEEVENYHAHEIHQSEHFQRWGPPLKFTFYGRGWRFSCALCAGEYFPVMLKIDYFSCGTKNVTPHPIPMHDIVRFGPWFSRFCFLWASTHQKASCKVTSPYGSVLHRTQNVTGGQFSFTTTQAGSYLACFWLDNHDPHQPGASVNVDWRIGIAAKDWDSIARKERIQGIELELRKLEGAVDTIHENLLYLKNREAEMREVDEITNTRVARCSIMSLGVCTGVSVFQLWYLRHFFQKKKLI